MISGGRAASISERESSLAFLKMTHYSTQPYARIDVGGKATRRCYLLPSGGAGDWRGPLQSEDGERHSLSSVHSPALAAGKLIHNLLCDGTV